MNRPQSAYHVGISGWNYPRWRKSFYPDDLPHRLELKYASAHLRTIEINGTFYSLQKPESFERWYSETPSGFIFSVKGPRFITHMKKLKGVQEPVCNFFASGVLALKEKLGPILWQLPPMLGYDRERLENFFDLLPRTSTAAAAMARHADDFIQKKFTPYTKIGIRQRLRYALEVRHESFAENHKEFLSLLKRYNIAVVCADAAAKWPFFRERTADFAYARLHGGSILYTSRYTPAQLKKWKRVAHDWHGKDHEVFIYFDNDAKVHAPFDAMDLQAILNKDKA